ncbi:MAG TPA: tetratricopeptide repeat protein [Sphingomicrobium sp.]|nr:tetratricopeptide repeat protein [Sphingomicrobium sp.]
MASRGEASGPGTTDSIDIAMSRARGSDQARELLTSQSHLIFTQELLARADLRHRGWQIIGERVGALLKIMTAVVGAMVLISLAAFVWSAHRASGMVMDPFSVPPTLDRQGLSGAVVAQQLLDKIAALESGTQSARAASSYENSLSDSKGVVVPYAGVSLAELRREARDWLGSENHVSGDVVQLPGGRIAISFRTLGQSGRVEGGANDLNGLLDQAALAVFKATQPYRHAIWLSRNGGTTDEVRALFARLSKSPDLRERPWALHGIANMASSDEESKAYEERALQLRPRFLPALSNLPFYAQRAGHDEETFRLWVTSAKGFLAREDDYTPSHARHYGLAAEANAAALKGDMTKAAKLKAEAAEFTADDTNTAFGPFEAAFAWSMAHDFAAAKAQLAAAGYLDLTRRAEAEKLTGPQPSLKHLIAIATNDFTTRASELLALMERYRRDAAAATDAGDRTRNLKEADGLRPSAAVLLAQAGQMQEAKAMIAPLPTTKDEVLRARAFVASLSRDPAADRLFAAAAARTPSLPSAQTMWAEALVRLGRFAQAETHAREALKLGPNSAEAGFWLGEALLGQGKAREAVASFDAAARQEPHWGRVQIKLGSALWMAGDKKGAVAALTAARSMALNVHDRTKVDRMLTLARASRTEA